MSMPAAVHGYGPMAFDQWSHVQTQAAQAYFMTNGYANYDFARSPNTSGGSDDSTNSKMDPKLSPRYREKRMKNNEAAKKSRKQRKEREVAATNENQELKRKLADVQTAHNNACAQLNKLEGALQNALNERDHLLGENLTLERKLRELQDSMNSAKHAAHHNVLREVTNANQFAGPKYEDL